MVKAFGGIIRLIGAFGVYPGADPDKRQRVVVELPGEVFAVVNTRPGEEVAGCFDIGSWAPATKYGLCPGEFEINERSKKRAREIIENMNGKPEKYDEALKARERAGKVYGPIEERLMKDAVVGYKKWLKEQKQK